MNISMTNLSCEYGISSAVIQCESQSHWPPCSGNPTFIQWSLEWREQQQKRHLFAFGMCYWPLLVGHLRPQVIHYKCAICNSPVTLSTVLLLLPMRGEKKNLPFPGRIIDKTPYTLDLRHHLSPLKQTKSSPLQRLPKPSGGFHFQLLISLQIENPRAFQQWREKKVYVRIGLVMPS